MLRISNMMVFFHLVFPVLVIPVFENIQYKISNGSKTHVERIKLCKLQRKSWNALQNA